MMTILYDRISKINKLSNDGSRNNLGLKDKMSPNLSRKKIADELKVSDKTLQRAEKYVDEIEDITKNVGKEITDKIVSGDFELEDFMLDPNINNIIRKEKLKRINDNILQ